MSVFLGVFTMKRYAVVGGRRSVVISVYERLPKAESACKAARCDGIIWARKSGRNFDMSTFPATASLSQLSAAAIIAGLACGFAALPGVEAGCADGFTAADGTRTRYSAETVEL